MHRDSPIPYICPRVHVKMSNWWDVNSPDPVAKEGDLILDPWLEGLAVAETPTCSSPSLAFQTQR